MCDFDQQILKIQVLLGEGLGGFFFFFKSLWKDYHIFKVVRTAQGKFRISKTMRFVVERNY